MSLETATIGGSVWLGFGTTELALRIGDPKVSQSASLLRDISDCLEEAGVKLAEVDLFACAAGPGSFTGLRIGIATLKALAASLNQPCVGIPTLNAVALAGGPSDATVALLPAGRGEVFAQMFSVKDDAVVALDSAAHLTPARLLERYAEFQHLKWAGSGAHAQRSLIEECARARNIRFFDEVSIGEATDSDRNFWYLTPPEPDLAKHVARLALQLFLSGEIQSPDALTAIYVRPSDAELNQCR